MAQKQYTGSESMGYVIVTLELLAGISSRPFNVNVTPLEQSPVSAEGNSLDNKILIAEYLINRWC